MGDCALSTFYCDQPQLEDEVFAAESSSKVSHHQSGGRRAAYARVWESLCACVCAGVCMCACVCGCMYVCVRVEEDGGRKQRFAAVDNNANNRAPCSIALQPPLQLRLRW